MKKLTRHSYLRIYSFTLMTVVLSGTSFVTIEPAPIVTFSPIVIGPIMIEPHPIIVPSLIRGCLL